MKIAVIGTGVMGQNHIRVLKNISAVKEIVICDINEVALKKTAEKFALQKTYADYDKLFAREHPDGVVVATLTNLHQEIALAALGKKIPVLVEKPIAANLKDANEMINAARKNEVVFTVGHVERCNPVITKIKEFLDKKIIKNIYVINTHRIGPFPKRLIGKTENVHIDLSAHDLDIIHYLAGNIQSIKSQVIRTGKQELYAHLLLDLKNGIKASSEFSWISPRYERSIEIYGRTGMLYGDYYNQEVWFYENSDFDHSPLTASFLGRGLVSPGRVIKYPLFKQEPLFLELSNFIGAIKKTEKILVQPSDSVEVLKIYLKIK